MRPQLIAVVATLALALADGCATPPTPAQQAAARPPAPPARAVSTSAASGMSFDPPGTAAAPDLSRAARTPSASNGLQPAVTTYDVTTSIQDQTTDGDYNQQSVTQRTGTVQR